MPRGIWITSEEIAQLPIEGTAWQSVLTAAESSWGTPKLNDQNNKHGLKVLAGAYVAVRMGSAPMVAKVRDGIMAAKRTMDQPEDWSTSNGVLALGRTLPAYVFAADLVGLEGIDDTEFRSWLHVMQTQKIGTHGRWNTLPGCHEDDAANWAAFAGAARVSIAAYLGDQAELDRCALVLESLFGKRTAFPVAGEYFNPSSGLHWSVGDADTWTGINGPGTKTISGVERDVDGCAVIDTGDGALGWPPPSMSYPWECMQGWYVQAEVLHRLGLGSYDWSNQALRRALAFMERAGWSITNPAKHVPWIANARYGSSFPTTSPNTDGRAVTWTDWTHAVGSVIPPPAQGPKITAIAPDHGEIGEPVRIHGSGFVNVDVVRFADANANFVVGGPTWIDTWVPLTAATGRVEVHTATGSATSPGEFTVMTEPPPPTDPDARVSLLLQALAELAAEQGDSWRRFGLKVNVIQGGS
jgi:hypothetical protein